MKAISLWQPWATAIALGSKRIETRSWATAYRGPLAIHAAKRCVKAELRTYSHLSFWQGALNRGADPSDPLWEVLPFGAIVAVCRLARCYPIHALLEDVLDEFHYRPWDTGHRFGWSEREMGYFGPGRFAWVLADVETLPEPIVYPGGQWLFQVPDELLNRKS
jgi:hypothetical protein